MTVRNASRTEIITGETEGHMPSPSGGLHSSAVKTFRTVLSRQRVLVGYLKTAMKHATHRDIRSSDMKPVIAKCAPVTVETVRERVARLEYLNSRGVGTAVTQQQFELACLRVLLASHEAEGNVEPVAFINGAWTLVYYRPPKELGLKIGNKLYTAPPAPVVPDRSMFERWWESQNGSPLDSWDSLRTTDGYCDDWIDGQFEAWNACRAAMLQGAEPVSNRDELPDGWVACSERMPDIGTAIFYFCQNDGLRDCGIVSSSNFSDKGDAELYVHAEGYDLRFGVDITHWMPLPAAPQQEA